MSKSKLLYYVPRGDLYSTEDKLNKGKKRMKPFNLKFLFFSIFLLVFTLAERAVAELKHQLIPRHVLFGPIDKAMPLISPDGKRISYLAADKGPLAIYVADINEPANGKTVTKGNISGMRQYFWGYDNNTIFYLLDNNGNEKWHLYKVDLSTFETTDLTPFEASTAFMVQSSKEFPNKFIITLNKENPQCFDLYELNVKSGTLKMLYKNGQCLSNFLLDKNYKIRFASKENDDGGRTIFQFDDKLNPKPFMKIVPEDSINSSLIALNQNGNILYLKDSHNRNTAALFKYDLASGKKQLLFHDPKADFSSVFFNQTRNNVVAVAVNYLKNKLVVIDPSISADIKFLTAYHTDAELHILSSNLDNKLWLVSYSFDNRPTLFYLYNKGTKNIKFLFGHQKNLEQYQLSKVRPFILKARDGMHLPSYLLLPASVEPQDPNSLVPKHPVPLIIHVHGGPYSRDSCGLNNEDQWLTSRGYAVLKINFRGSSGFGKNFATAGHGEYAAKMQNDLIDGFKWAIKNKITTKDKVCIYGHSYGGYSALAGLAFTPDLFACGIDISGMSNLYTLLKATPLHWKSVYKTILKRFGGDPDTEEGQKFLLSQSPISFAKNIKKPLLIIHGANDQKVPKNESDQIVAEMKKNNISVTYVLYPNEGHLIKQYWNRMSFHAIAEQFLSKVLGGDVEPIANELTNSSFKILSGSIE